MLLGSRRNGAIDHRPETTEKTELTAVSYNQICFNSLRDESCASAQAKQNNLPCQCRPL